MIEKLLQQINICGYYLQQSECGDSEFFREYARKRYEEEVTKIEQIKAILGIDQCTEQGN